MNFTHLAFPLCLFLAGTAALAAPRPPSPVASAIDAPALPVAVAPTDPAVRYTGRFDTTKGDPRCEWSNCTVALKFRGTALNALLEDPGMNFWEVEIDGQPVRKMSLGTGPHVYAIASGLPLGDHLVRLVRATEAGFGPTQIHGFQLNAGGMLLPVPECTRKLEVIGDSISCGDSNEGTPDTDDPTNIGENGYFTYGARTAQKFGADYTCIAWSGRKMWPDNTVPELYGRTIPTEKDSVWDFSKWTPDAIVINLSTNDFGHPVVPDQASWIKAYESFIAVLRGHFPNAPIYCATSVMLTGDRLALSKACLAKIVSDLNAAGDHKVKLLEFATEDWNNGGVGGHGHPSMKTDGIMADKLSTQLAGDLGWTPAGP